MRHKNICTSVFKDCTCGLYCAIDENVKTLVKDASLWSLMPEKRPVEITMLVILQGIGATGWLLIGSLAVLSGGLAGAFFEGLSAVIVGIGWMLILNGAAEMAITCWLWKGRSWARRACMMLATISIVLTIPSIITGAGLVRILLDMSILFILTRAQVKAFYARASEAGSKASSN